MNPNLLQLLLGGSAGAPFASPQPPQNGVDPLAPLPGDAPVVNQQMGYTPPVSSAPQTSQPPPPAPVSPGPMSTGSNPNAITIPGQRPDDWKPHGTGLLGQIADYFLGTHIGKHNDDTSMEEALQPLLSNPKDPGSIIKTLNRVRQVDPSSAVKLYNYITDNQRQQGTLDRENRALDAQNTLRANTMAANMMHAVVNNYGTDTVRGQPAWAAARQQALAYANTLGVDASAYIPETYDPNSLDTIALGMVPVKAQMQMAETAKRDTNTQTYQAGRLEQDQQGLGIRQQNANTAARGVDVQAQRNSIMGGHYGEEDAQGAERGNQSAARTQAYVGDHPSPALSSGVIRDPAGNIAAQWNLEKIGGAWQRVATLADGRRAVINMDKHGKVISAQPLNETPPAQ